MKEVLGRTRSGKEVYLEWDLVNCQWLLTGHSGFEVASEKFDFLVYLERTFLMRLNAEDQRSQSDARQLQGTIGSLLESLGEDNLENEAASTGLTTALHRIRGWKAGN